MISVKTAFANLKSNIKFDYVNVFVYIDRPKATCNILFTRQSSTRSKGFVINP